MGPSTKGKGSQGFGAAIETKQHWPSGDIIMQSRRNHLVLVVDDIPDNITMLTAHLRTKGYRTIAANDGIEAIRLTTEEKPDIVMMDINMPRMNGLDACKVLKEQADTKMIPIILVTANSIWTIGWSTLL